MKPTLQFDSIDQLLLSSISNPNTERVSTLRKTQKKQVRFNDDQNEVFLLYETYEPSNRRIAKEPSKGILKTKVPIISANTSPVDTAADIDSTQTSTLGINDNPANKAEEMEKFVSKFGRMQRRTSSVVDLRNLIPQKLFLSLKPTTGSPRHQIKADDFSIFSPISSSLCNSPRRDSSVGTASPRTSLDSEALAEKLQLPAAENNRYEQRISLKQSNFSAAGSSILKGNDLVKCSPTDKQDLNYYPTTFPKSYSTRSPSIFQKKDTRDSLENSLRFSKIRDSVVKQDAGINCSPLPKRININYDNPELNSNFFSKVTEKGLKKKILA